MISHKIKLPATVKVVEPFWSSKKDDKATLTKVFQDDFDGIWYCAGQTDKGETFAGMRLKRFRQISIRKKA